MNVESPVIVATSEILWLREDGREVVIQAIIGLPYEQDGNWACPVALVGVDERYPDIIGESSMQAIHLAIRLIRQRLGHLLDAGEVLVDQSERDNRWNVASLNAVFGQT
jgi:hypothetical protein